eukprot:gene2070-4046_t
MINFLHIMVALLPFMCQCLHKSRLCGRNFESFVLLAKKSGSKSKGADTNSVTQDSPKPARVTSNINVPIRQQIAWAKAYKRLMTSQSTSTGVTKKFRKAKGPKEAEEQYVEIDFKKTKPPAIFVDGYNIIGYINSVEGRNIDFDEARDCLISDLAVLRGATGWWIEVIFDAYESGLGGGSTCIDNVYITYTTASETADNHIERRFAELRQEGFQNMVVATDDKVLQMVAGAVGAGYISANMMVEELRIAYKGWENVETELVQEEKKMRTTIGDSLPEDVRRAIEMMRKGK